MRFVNVHFVLMSILFVFWSEGRGYTVCQKFYERASNKMAKSVFDQHYEGLLDSFDLNFKSMTNPELEKKAIAADLSDGYNKRKILRSFLYDFEKDNYTTPTFRQFLSNYKKWLDLREIPEANRIYPALVLIRGSILSEKGDYDIKFVTPGLDPWPQELGYRIFQIGNGQDPFNVPPKDMVRAHHFRRFPLIAFHDSNHFASFALYNKYSEAINDAFRNITEFPKWPSFEMRLFIVLEYLSLGNPNFINVMKRTFITPEIQHSDGYISLRHFNEAFFSVGDLEVVNHAHYMAKAFDKMMIDYGGASFRSYEKGSNQITDFHKAIGSILLPMPKGKVTNLINSKLSSSAQNNLPSLLSMFKATEVQPNRVQDDILSALKISDWGELRDGSMPPIKDSRDFILYLIRKELARIEYFLWNSSHIPIGDWVKTLLNDGSLDPDTPTMLILRDYLSADSEVYRRIFEDYKK